MEMHMNIGGCTHEWEGPCGRKSAYLQKLFAVLFLTICVCFAFGGCEDALDADAFTEGSAVLEIPCTFNESSVSEETYLTTATTENESVPAETKNAPAKEVHVHSYITVVTDPTCTTGGYSTLTCDCGESYQTDHTEPVGHSYKSDVTIATCTDQGYTTYTCHCGDNYKAEITDAVGHSYQEKVTTATCTENGYTTYTCSSCGDSYTGDHTNATGHNWSLWTVTLEPTATAEGEEQRVCESCGKADMRSIARLPEETEPIYESFSGSIGTYSACNMPYIDWKGDTEQAAFIEVFTVEKSDKVLNELAKEFEKVYGFAPSLDNKYYCTYTCDMLGVYTVDGYTDPQIVYHYTITDKTYIYITNDMYKVYVQQCDDGSVWVGYCIYATMDTISDERSKEEVQALHQKTLATFAELIGIAQDDFYDREEELDLRIGYISEAGTVRSVHSNGLVDVLYIYCRGFSVEDNT